MTCYNGCGLTWRKNTGRIGNLGNDNVDKKGKTFVKSNVQVRKYFTFFQNPHTYFWQEFRESSKVRTELINKTNIRYFSESVDLRIVAEKITWKRRPESHRFLRILPKILREKEVHTCYYLQSLRRVAKHISWKEQFERLKDLSTNIPWNLWKLWFDEKIQTLLDESFGVGTKNSR